MEQYDLHLILGKRRLNQDYYPLTIKVPSGDRHFAKLFIPPYFEGPNAIIPTGVELGANLHKALNESDLWHIFDNCFSAAKSTYSQGSLLFEIKAPEFYPLPWENIFDAPEWTPLSEVFTVVRYLSKPSTVVVTPLYLPVDVLIVSDITEETLQQLPSENTLKYYRATKSIGVSADHLRAMLGKLQYDIVHITGRAEFRDNKDSVFFPGLAESEITPRELRSLLKRCGARFLILHCFDESYGYGELLRFAHNIFHAQGPSIAVTYKGLSSDSWSFDNLYLDIVHDYSLDSALKYIPKDMKPVLLTAAGGADVLRISPVAPRLHAQLESQLQFAQSARDILAAQKEQLDLIGDLNKAETLLKDLNLFDEVLQEKETLLNEFDSLYYSAESGGMKPMTSVEILRGTLDKRLKAAEARTKRVVNSWFSQDERIIGGEEGLKPNTSYNYEVQIGIASKKSNVRNAVAIPEEELVRFYAKQGLTLRVVLYSSEFQIAEPEKLLILPPQPHESDPVLFVVTSPGNNCVARMRVCIYFEQNLIQSLMVQAAIGEPQKEKASITGNMAEVDFCLSGSLTNIERFPARALNITVNERNDGTHSFYIKGSSLTRHFDFGEGEISSSVKEVREMLQDICSEKDSRGNLRYRYGADNRGNRKDFIKDLTALAELGSLLYTEIVTHQDRNFLDQLTQTLGKPEATIQISSTKSAKYVFPWALVYDKRLVQGSYDICPQFLADLKYDPPRDLQFQQCIQNGCPHEADASIICPSGFWGYKHIIEQPLSLETKAAVGLGETPMEIKTQGMLARVMMGVSLNLQGVKEHHQELEMSGSVDIDFLQSKQQIGIGMQRQDLHLIYFYCHGGRKGPQTWLGVGKNEKIFSTDLVSGWRVNWPTNHPLVFINGCRTVDVTPDDFVDFNTTLSWCEASGVVGTEITIPESLARHFANGFFQRFLKGQNVGEAIRNQRLAMLGNLNLLGLVYTPYCSANLRLVNTN